MMVQKSTFLVYYHPLILAPMMEISTVDALLKCNPFDETGGNLAELVHLQ